MKRVAIAIILFALGFVCGKQTGYQSGYSKGYTESYDQQQTNQGKMIADTTDTQSFKGKLKQHGQNGYDDAAGSGD